MMAIIALVLGIRPRTRTIISHNILDPGNDYYLINTCSSYSTLKICDRLWEKGALHSIIEKLVIDMVL